MIPLLNLGGMVAWIPLVDPLYSIYPNLANYWLPLLVPLALVVSLVYQGVKHQNLNGVTAATFWMTVKILFFMALICAGVQLFYILTVAHTTRPW
jgi:hypothetical protein